MHYRPDFLIVGMERSGTHWVAALLDNHPDIACFPTLPFYNEIGEQRVGEMHFFNTLASLEGGDERKFVRPFSDFAVKYNKVFSDLVHFKDELPKTEVYRIFQERYGEICDMQRGDKKIVGEATPAYVFHLDFIDSLYPEIKKLCILRDPKDKIVSWHFNMLRKGRKEDAVIDREFAIGYLEERIIPEYQALLAYQGPVHCLTYEALDEYTYGVVGDMVRYLGMPISPKILAYMIEEASFEKQTARDSHSAGRGRGEENVKSGFRKGVVGDWKNHLSEDLADEVDRMALDYRKKIVERFDIRNKYEQE
ncbi:MAG: sulfotransferase domain-containing protein [Candidatus Sungbacteria bacterium]|nr:sulfotransferase domain-containing protein [Candidatus Sungbacteria bacterium]